MSICTENNIFSVFFVLSGALTTLSQQWAEHTNATSSAEHEKIHPFKHPFFLQCGKFFGQLFCLLLYGIVFGRCGGTNIPLPPPRDPQPQATNQAAGQNQPRQLHSFALEEPERPSWKKIIFLPCALCDLAGTGMLYVGLKLTYSSSFIMLKGSVLFFTSLLSVAFLARNLQTQMWVGIGVSISGMAVIGLGDYVYSGSSTNYDAYGIAAGDLLIVMAQIMVATRVVLEQKFVTKHNIHPLLAVGLEGLFGFVITVILLIPFNFIHAGDFSKLNKHLLEDSLDAFMQIKSTWQIALAFIGCVVSVAFYYYFGIDFARKHGAISRMVLDGLGWLVAWTVMFALSWYSFYKFLILGFILVVIGILLYSDYILLSIFTHVRIRLNRNNVSTNILPINPSQEDRVHLLAQDANNQEGLEGPGGPPHNTPPRNNPVRNNPARSIPL